MRQNNVIVWMDRLIRVSFYALIFFLPISIALVSIFSAFAIFFFLVKRILVVSSGKVRGFQAIIAVLKPTPSFLYWPLLFFIAAVLLSVILSQDHRLSILAFFGKILRGVYIYASFLEAFKEVKHINNFILVWFTSAFVTAVSGLSQYFGGIDFLRNTLLIQGRVSSSMRHANDLGAYLVSVCPLLLTAFLYRNWFKEQSASGKNRVGSPGFLEIFFLIAFLVLSICVGLTFSRSAWGAFIVASVVVALFRKKIFPIVLIFLSLFYVAFSPLMVQVRDTSLIADHVRNGIPPAHQEQAVQKNFIQYFLGNVGMGRWEFWTEALHIIRDYPIWGSGLNTYSKMGQKYRIDWGGYPHNSYLQMTAEMGLLGLGAFLWMMIVLFWHSLLYIRRVSEGFTRTAVIGSIAGILAYLMQSFFDTTFYSVQLSVLFWLMVSLVVALQKIPLSHETLTKVKR